MIFIGLILVFLSIADSKVCNESEFGRFVEKNYTITNDSFVIPWYNETNKNNVFCACQDHYYGAYYHKNIYNLHKLKIKHDCPSVLPLKELAIYIDLRSEFTAKIENYGKSLDGLCERFQDELLDSYIRYGWKHEFSKAFCDLYYYYEHNKKRVFFIKQYENWMFERKDVVIEIRNFLKPFSWFLTTRLVMR